MENFEKDILNPNELDRLRDFWKGQLQETKVQLIEISQSLQELAQEIQNEHPDIVMFLDKGARPFAIPYKRFLEDTMGDASPELLFFNDGKYKGQYVHEGKVDLPEEYSDVYSKKKIFFIDETFSGGTGLATIARMCELLGVEYHYYALTKDPEPAHQLIDVGESIDFTEHQDYVKSLFSDGKATVYENPIAHLFTSQMAKMYVKDDENQQTTSVHVRESDMNDSIPSADKYITLPEGVTLLEFQQERSTLMRSYILQTRELILEAIKGELKD